MAQDVLVWSDVYNKMAEEPCLLKEDGYLNADTDLKQIVYHPTLNVILICTNSGLVRVLDVNSGLVLQSTSLSAKNCSNIFCRYIPGQDRVLFCDGQSLGVRSDYNGVLLLDTILQKTIPAMHQNAKFELLLTEAIILRQCLTHLRGTSSGVDCVYDELTCKIQNAQMQSKKGIKAQKWNTVCLQIPLEYVGFVTSNLLNDLMLKNQHNPEISVVSAMQERVSELMGETAQASNRRAMASEAKRRETFAHWPHMDYLWALPDQMAQAGFYHQPNSAGDDRAMCFTCTVCLVSWERTDEPWNEHERHSPTCPFVMGEYTQNVPLSVTYATSPGIDCTYRGAQVNTIGTSSVSHLIATANPDGLIAVYDVSGKIKRTHVFYVKTYDSHLLEKYTQDFGLPGMRKDGIDDNSIQKKITALTIVGDKNTKHNIRPTIICGISIKCGEDAEADMTLNEANVNIMEVDDSQDFNSKISCLYLVVYDFQYTKEVDLESPREVKTALAPPEDSSATNADSITKKLIIPKFGTELFQLEQDFDDYMLKQELSQLYHSIIPGESDEIYIPKSLPTNNNNNTKQHSGPRMISMDAQNSETDAAQMTSIIIPMNCSAYHHTPVTNIEPVEKSISDHIVELQNAGVGKKLNYSRAVQCISIPLAYKNRQDLCVSDILPTPDGKSVLVVLKSICDINSSVLLLYALNLSGKMVKLQEEPTGVRELNFNETPVEINVINFLDKNVEHNVVEGLAIMVCVDGAVRVVELTTLTTVSQAKLDSQKFVSAVYCNSLERLCASTEQGSLHFFALTDTDADSVEEHDDEECFNLNTDMPSVSTQTTECHESIEATRCFHEPPEYIVYTELKRLRQLCEFEVFKGGYNPVVPPCWTEMHQAQRQRRHPQHLQCEKEQITKSFRLQTDTTTWDEHVFEITLPTPINIGHVDVSFTLHGSAPKVEFTLLRQNTTSIGLRREVTFAVDDTVSFDQLQGIQNPVTSQEYLRSHNAEILAGPIAIETCIDLSELSGCVSLTSPKLFKLRNRNLLLHMKAVCGDDSKRPRIKRSIGTSGDYMGCDALHEISITVYSSMHTDIPHERSLRCSMLESTAFVSNLLLTITEYKTKEEQALALDILNWVATVRMARNRNTNGEAPSQQVELLTVIASFMTGLLNSCIIHGSRSIAHTCVKLLVTCSEGAALLTDNETSYDDFDEAVLTSILEILDNIYSIQSSGSLHWLMTLLSKVTKNADLVKQISSKIVVLLANIADQITERNNSYHLILRSRYGLYGTPLEPEIFDIDLPVPQKGSSTTISYASAVAGDNPPQMADFHTNFAFNKDHLDPKDVLLNLGETKTKLKNIAPAMLFRGLLETEALHFTCASASDGTRVERADAGTAGVIHNFIPISVSQFGYSGTKKVEIEQLFQDFNLVYPDCKVGKPTISSHMENAFANYNGDTVLLFNEEEEAKLNGIEDIPVPTPQETTAAKIIAEETLLPHKSLAWQQLLVTPPAQVIVVERMHSGARRFVTLDFGQPLILTDIFLPSCAELLSISIDIWLKGEDTDAQRLVHATDIGTKNLVLSDLQPRPLCRYLKITVVGRYGMSPTRCRIPVGSYYGHMIVLPDEVPLEYTSVFPSTKPPELEKQLGILSMLFEDVSCRYSLSCFKLKRLLDPFLMSDTTNTAHLNAYMDIMKDKQNCSNSENVKIFNAYQEAVTYQRQLNAVRTVMRRIESTQNNSLPNKIESPADVPIDKLRAIAEVLFEMLLIVDVIPKISMETCEKLFQGYCISQQSHLQFLAATVLDHSCRKRAFWGVFLSRTMAKMFSSSYTNIYPQDRVFILLAYLVKRCSERSVALDANLKVIAEVLHPLSENRSALVGVTIDLSLLSWLLLFLSLQLDLSKSSMQNSTRWDWVTGEFAGKTNETANSTYKRKLHKKFLLYKQQLDTLDHKQLAQELAEKMEEAYKGTSIMLDKMKDIKKSIKISLVPPYLQQQGSSKPLPKRRREIPSETGDKSLPIQDPQYIDAMHSLAVVKGILTLLLSIDHSCSADLFVLSCKVIARLIKLSNLSMDEYLDDEKLLKLVNLGINSDLPFVTHALACLLQDSLDIGKTPTNKEPDALVASTSWNSDILRDVESLCDFEIEDAFISEPVVKQGKTSMNSNHLPSVFESDDSEIEDFLDEVIERGRSLLKKGPKASLLSYGSSCAMDQRLNVSVDLQVEMTLRRLVHFNTYSLLQSLNAPANVVEMERTLLKWPERLLAPLMEEPKRSSKDTNMLTNCFDMLFTNLELQSYSKIEQILQLWLTLNCQSDDKFNPTTMPFIQLSNDAIASLIKTVACCSDLTLRTWCAALQILTLMCNVPQGSLYDTNETDIGRLFGKTSVILYHPDFVKLFLRLLSGSGIQYCDKGLAGPGLCKAMHDFMIRLQMRCDVTNPTSAPGIRFKSHMLKVVYHLVQPSGPLASKLGPLDAQCKLLHSLACLDYNNADLNIAMSILESTGTLTLSHVLNAERIKCVNIGERLNSSSVNSFNFIFASVLGGENTKQDKPVSWDLLLIYLLKLLSNLIKTPFNDGQNNQTTYMDTGGQPSSQTDESKAEQINQEPVNPPRSSNVPCLADTVLQHHPTVIRFCKALASCKTTTLSMIPHSQITSQNPLAAFTDSATVGDAVFNVLSSLARNATQKQFIMAPLLLYLSQTPQLSEPLIWFIIQVLDSPESLNTFVAAGGIDIICKSLITSSNAPNTVSAMGSIASVMQHFIGQTNRTDASAIGVPSNTKKQQQASLENNLNLINFAPQGSIKCSTSSTAHSPEILIQGGQAAHRRARAPQWSYHFYPEEAHADLTITLPSAILLREVHIQPHQGTLATCPSAVSLEVSANGPSRLVPACPPIPTSGMSFIRLHLPAPEVVNCVQIRLYKPREASNIGLSQIRLLGTSAFGGNNKQQILDLAEDESHCRFSLGWLRLFYHCCTENSEAQSDIIAKAAAIPNLLSTCCGLLLVPTHIPSLYLGNLGKIVCELCLHSRENAAQTIRMLLESKSNTTESTIFYNSSGGKLLLNSPGAQSACEVLYKLCSFRDDDTAYRMGLVLSWLTDTTCKAIENSNNISCSPAYISIIASIIWDAKESHAEYLDSMITASLFETVYNFNSLVKDKITALKFALDSLLCSLCYVKSEFFPLLLQKMGVLIPNQSTDLRAPISDDRKESERMTDDSKHSFDYYYEWYERLIINDVNDLLLSNEVLDTIALVGRSPIVIQQLLDSRLPHMLNAIIYDYCNGQSENPAAPMCTLKNVTAILKFFADICEEKLMRDWLGSPEGSHFWLPLLQYLCKNGTGKKSSLRSTEHTYLEEVCVRFLSKCCLCHSNNQTLLAKVLCEVISQQTSGISGFLRRLVLQLLLESEKILVSVKAYETLYMNSTVLHPYMPLHPAYKQTYGRALLFLGTNTTIADLLEQYISFSTTIKTNPANLKMEAFNEIPKVWTLLSSDSDLTVAAGVTAKDKRAKDAKNIVTSTPLKKKRYITDETRVNDIVDGRVVKCTALSDNRLPLDLTLAQVLKMIEDKGTSSDLTCLNLSICQSKGDNEEDANKHKLLSQAPLSNTLQVFSAMGGLALLAQHLPTVYPETMRTPPSDKPASDNSESDWIKVDGSDDIYEDIDEGLVTSTPTKSPNSTQNVPAHSLTAFGLFLRLPGYAEVLLKDMKKAHGLLRLVLGVTDDGEGGDIFQSPIADSLPTLPFEVLKRLYDASPLSTDDGTVLRRLSISIGVIHLLLACLGIFTHQTQNTKGDKDSKNKDDKSQLYWAKGTGFGTGSTQQSWNVEQALLKQRSEEEHVTVLLQVLSSYINPKGKNTVELSQTVLPAQFEELLANSAVLPALCSYLRNDSVLDMARHIPLYRAALELLRAMAVSSQLVKMLLPQSGSKDPSISTLLKNMKTCVDTYASKLRSAQTLKSNKKTNNNKNTGMKIKYKSGEQLEEMERDEGLAMLMPDIQLTATLVCIATDKLIEADEKLYKEMTLDRPMSISPEEQYLKLMKKLQFDTFEMLEELPEGGYKFTISHHYETNVRSAGDASHPARVKRLAQEAVTLATSLPLSHSSSVFVRCDTDRLDIMKVLITGPSDTPYANGCFEFDIYFPPEYPLAPMLINLETTGHHTVRFNPNLYNDGKVCLSVLNTWHGRPEEKWNAQTSSFLQVLVSIQSLILVPEPYFNEPGYERSRGTPAGTQSSREYNTNICQATTRWAMLEQLANPCPCFKDVIFAHFYIKRHEVMEQVERWIKDLENDNIEKRTNRTSNKRNVFTTLDTFKKLYDKLKSMLLKLPPPEGLEDTPDNVMEIESISTASPPPEDLEATSHKENGVENEANDLVEIDMEKMVSDMCE